jgi:hypothetical protein
MPDAPAPAQQLSPRQQRQLRRQQRQEARQQRQQRRQRRRQEQSPSTPQPPGEAAHALESTPFVDSQRRPLYLEDLYFGASLFMVLSGPSLWDLDLNQLNRRGIATIGINQSPSMWRTSFWTYVDRARKFHDGIWHDPGILKIIPRRHFGQPLMRKVDGKFVRMVGANGQAVQAKQLPGVIGYERNAFFRPDRWLAEPSINWGNSKRSARRNRLPRGLNVMFAVIKIAYALGFRRVYLLGCDFCMDQQRPYAFDQSKDAGGVGGNNNFYRIMNDMFGSLRPYFDAANFQLFNCNPESGLTVFPHVSFHDALTAATQAMPVEPWDTNDWYNTSIPLPAK